MENINMKSTQLVADSYKSYHHSVYLYIYYKIGKDEEAKDLSQDVFLRLNVFLICLALTAFFTALFFVVDSTSISTIFIINCLKSLAYAPTIPLLWAMMGDVADHSEWVNHRRATGFVFAGVVFALKAGLGIGGAICGAIVDSFGFVSNTVQTENAIFGIRLTSSVIPAITFFVGVIALFFYPISKKLNEHIQDDLAKRRLENN